jgi:hypothetical protein
MWCGVGVLTEFTLRASRDGAFCVRFGAVAARNR